MIKLNEPKPTKKTNTILLLVEELREKTARDIHIDYGTISSYPGAPYTIADLHFGHGYAAIRYGLTLNETEEYLRGFLRGWEWANEETE